VLGLLTRWLAVLAGLAPVFLFITGLWRWIERSRAGSRKNL
jgi:uncharacterized iron-regulated membrane protein